MNEDRIYESLSATPEGEGARESNVADASAEASEPTDAGAMIEENPAEARRNALQRGGKKKEGADMKPSASAGGGMERVSSDAMSVEQRRGFAAKRRRAEQRDAVDRAVSSALEQERERRKSERDEAAFRERIDAELREIHRLDPSIRSPEDLLKMPAAREFYEYVRRGNTFIDAYYLANRERLTAAAAEAARQQTMNAHRSKDHLHPSGNSRGAGAASVPAEEMQMFKLLNPAASEAEIQAYYNRSR